MGYIFGILRKTKSGLDRSIHRTNTNHYAHVERSRLVKEEGVIATTPILKADLHQYQNEQLPLVFKTIIKESRKGEAI